ncbi:MAG: Flp pilus assembly protein CpaB [Actinomycetota bacterium]|nr:Flp pilus assembly protein CpaB [Actinomycetota bacterium]
MRSRGLVVAIAVVLAVAAAAAVILYTQGVKEEALVGGRLETVIVSTQEILPNEPLDDLVGQGVFRQIRVPNEALVSDAVRDVTELDGATTTATIYANEQIPASRLSTSEQRPNSLGISQGHIGVALELDAPQGGAGNIQPGDNVSVFATYQNIQVGAAGQSLATPDFTATLVPTVKVLRIENPQVDTETGDQQNNTERIRVTLDLEPKQAQDLVFAQENGLVWLGLLPPDELGTQPGASTVPLGLLRGARLG